MTAPSTLTATQGVAPTPGPWVALDADSFDGCHYIPIETDQPTGPDCRLICEVRPDACEDDGNISETDLANARLIAAAPELLRVAELLVDWLDEEEGAHKLCDTARAAIAKALGK